MKKMGMTLIESVVTIAILGIIFLLAAPLVRSFGGVSSRAKTQREIDAEFSVVNEFIQKKVRAAKSAGNYAEVLDSSGNPTTRDGVELHLEIPIEGSTTPDSVAFIFRSNELVYEKYDDDETLNETLMENVAQATFAFQEGIVLYYIDLDIGDYEDKLRSSFKGSASTRIDIDY